MMNFLFFTGVLMACWTLTESFYRPVRLADRHCRPASSTTSATTVIGQSVGLYEELKVPTLDGIFFVDITPEIKRIVKESGVHTGSVTVLSRHTTTAITINEMESRLVDDARQFLLKLVPAAYPYLHNDLHLRKGPEGWPGGDVAWRAQVRIPVHPHTLLICILCGFLFSPFVLLLLLFYIPG